MFNEHEISLLRLAVRVETMLQDEQFIGHMPDMEELKVFVKYVRGKNKIAKEKKIEIAIHPLLLSAVNEVCFAPAKNRDPDISAIAADDPRAVGMLGYSARIRPHPLPSAVLDAALAAITAGSAKQAAQIGGSAELPAAPNVEKQFYHKQVVQPSRGKFSRRGPYRGPMARTARVLRGGGPHLVSRRIIMCIDTLSHDLHAIPRHEASQVGAACF
ncbi:hypothetical protein FA95DRAFT_1566660 [Auriscalpium vulgare]|uniref:Uncharacterized protein n=1 Tax=Auriscalpium vulgare TaxID=40419 RepID=A0ACB8R960_9AGAM|nr:hypothetical protein FA95DRAFT_1566660 [Auriscalpium vulgare]